MLDHLKKFDDPLKIKRTFDGLVLRKSSIEFYVSIFKKQKKKITAKALKMQGNEVYFTTTVELAGVNHQDEIYCYVENSDIVFKAKITLASGFKIALKMPTEVYYQENNITPRLDVSDQNILASFNPVLEKGKNYKSRRKPAKVINYNEGGVALSIDKTELSNFLVGDELTLKYALGERISKTGTIMHITPSEEVDQFILGIKIHEPTISEWTGVFKL